MNPAYSVIVFTTASGAGYGLLIGLAAFGAPGLVPISWDFGLVGFGLALGLISAGLMASTLHLGHPERAWRAFGQWRSSWLSREGVFALATYVPASALAIVSVFFESAQWVFAVAAILSIAGALATLWSTGMIYASLPTVRAWHQPLVAPVYVVLGLATGGVLFHVLALSFGGRADVSGWSSVALLVLGYFMKRAYWRAIDTADRTHTAEAATGLGQFGKVRSLDPPHTQANFVMREMGYRVARKHALKLRRIVEVLLFVAPTAGVLSSLVLDPAGARLTSFVALLSAAIGVVIERWLFFAEAEHVVMLYYGAERE